METDIEREIVKAMRAQACANIDWHKNTVVLVLTEDAHCDLMHSSRAVRFYTSEDQVERYRGAVIAITRDSKMPRVTVLGTRLTV